jgi:hypothetical protein
MTQHKHNDSDSESLSVSLCNELSVSQQVLNRTTSTHDLIEAELFRTGTKAAQELRSVDNVGNMATAEGLKKLVSDAGLWMAANRASLKFSAFDGELNASTSTSTSSSTSASTSASTRANTSSVGVGGCMLEFDLETPSMLLLRLEKAGQQKSKPSSVRV